MATVAREPPAGAIDAEAHGGHFALCLMLGIAYACSLGGMATLIGTPTNALLAAFLPTPTGWRSPSSTG